MAYTNLTTEFDFKDLLTWQNMDKLAENDAFDTLPANTQMVFFQASPPPTWQKVTDMNDGLCRVVDGTGGGTGGSQNFSTAFSAIAHTHIIASHTHSLPNHRHVLGHSTTASLVDPSTRYVASPGSPPQTMQSVAAGGTGTRVVLNRTADSGSGTSGGQTATANSSLTNITLQYIDVILCRKGS